MISLSSSLRRVLAFSIVAALSFGAALACNNEASSGDDDPSGGSTGEAPSCDDACAHASDVCSQLPASSCLSSCSRLSDSAKRCFAEASSCTDVASCGTASSGGNDAGNNGNNTSSGTCDGKAHCSSDGRSREICTKKNGVQETVSESCVVGRCSNGACGACSGSGDCSASIICACKDGSNQLVTESGQCQSKQCVCSWGSCTLTNSVCPGKCAAYGGWKGN